MIRKGIQSVQLIKKMFELSKSNADVFISFKQLCGSKKPQFFLISHIHWVFKVSTGSPNFVAFNLQSEQPHRVTDLEQIYRK